MLSKFIKSRSFRLLIGVLALIFFSLFLAVEADEDDWYHIPILRQAPVEILPTPEAGELKPPLSIIFGGDMMLSRTVNAKMVSYDDYAWPFLEIASTTAAADLAVANLESPFLKDADYTVLTGSFSFKADPRSIDGLVLAGIDVVSLANNHILNAGTKGLKDTLSLLAEKRISAAGAGLDEAGARKPAIVEKNGWKIAFLAYAYPSDNSVATANRPGIATMDAQDLAEDIAAIRDEVDLVIVQMHAGTEYVSRPGKAQMDFARAAIDAGADAVIGHHPHWPQSWEIYEGKPIFYSLGNFVFDQMWSTETSRGMLAALTFNSDRSGRAELLPIEIVDFGQARLLSEEKSAAFWKSFKLDAPVQITWPARADN